VQVDPCSPVLAELGITDFAFSYKPDEGRLPCLRLLGGVEDSDVWFYGRR